MQRLFNQRTAYFHHGKRQSVGHAIAHGVTDGSGCTFVVASRSYANIWGWLHDRSDFFPLTWKKKDSPVCPQRSVLN